MRLKFYQSFEFSVWKFETFLITDIFDVCFFKKKSSILIKIV